MDQDTREQVLRLLQRHRDETDALIAELNKERPKLTDSIPREVLTGAGL